MQFPTAEHPSARSSRRTRHTGIRRVSSLAAAILVVLGLMAAGAPSASAAPAGVFTIEHFVRYQNVNSTTTDVASGDAFRYIVNYTCTNDVCGGGTLSIPFPAGYTVANPTYNTSHLTNLTRTGNSLVFTIAPNLDPGTTGQIDVEASTAGFTTPDGTTFAQAATIAVDEQADVVSATVTVTARAASDTTVTVTRTAGGASDDVARYSVAACNLSTGAPRTGGLRVLAGSTVTVHLPAGAVVERAGDGVVTGSPPSISWTMTEYANFDCRERQFVVSYPASDGANALGATKAVTAEWNRSLHAQSASVVTGNRTDTLGARTVGLHAQIDQVTPHTWGDAPTKKVDYGSTASYIAAIVNTGIGTLETADATIDLPPELFATNISAYNPGQGPGSVHVTTSCGPDRIAGTPDDGDEEPFGDIDPEDSLVGSTTSTWPNGSAALPSDCFTTSVRVHVTGVWPADGAQVLTVAAEPRNPDRLGDPTERGDDMTTNLRAEATNSAGVVSRTGSVDTEINGAAPPPPADPNTYVTVRSGGPGQLPASTLRGDASTSAYIGNLPLVDPVMTVMLPPNVSLVSWTGVNHGNGTPDPTLTQVPDYDGNGWTLLRWTFDDGVTLPVGIGYQINYTVERNEFAYGDLRMPAYVHSAGTTPPMRCTENYFGSQPDAFDVDQDGDTLEHGCLWPADMSVAAAASASITTRIRGSFDSAFVAGPATGQTAPGSDDDYRVDLKNTGTTELDQLVVVEKLPRPGDTRTLGSGQRNATSNTFPVVLRGTPTVPSLPTGAVLSWSDVTGACQPELGYSPSGCNDPAWHDWTTDPPADVADVLMIKVDFGANVLRPGIVWSVGIPVTTPTTGATEADRADFNPDPLTTPNEKAVNTIAFKGQRKDISTALAATEPPGVTLEVPGALGPLPEAPAPSPVTTTGTGTARQTATVTPPTGGTVHLLDGTTPVSTLVVDGVGTYRVDPTTGALTFDPEVGSTGTADPVPYRVTDSYGQTGDSDWTATVLTPAAPTAADLTSTGPVRTDQVVTVTVPTGGSARLLDGSVPVDRLVVADVGTYTIDPSTGRLTFSPASAFRGTPPAIAYVVEDAYGQSAEGTYTPTVTLASLSASPLSTTGIGTAAHAATIPVPPHGAVHLLDGATRVTTRTIPGEGTYTIDPATGAVSFLPVLGFSGAGTALSFERSDDFGQTATSTWIATVTPPAPPTAPSLRSSSTPAAPLAPQTVTVTPPANTSVTLVDADGAEVTTVTIPGEGTFVLDPATGIITFTPVDGFTGPSSQVPVRLGDAYGQSSTGSYTAAIAERPVVRLPVETGTPGPQPSITVTVPPGATITLVGPDGTTGDRIVIDGQGTYTLDPATGTITFTPVEGFTGTPTPITYRITAADGEVSEGSFAPTVVADAAATPGASPTEPTAPRSGGTAGACAAAGSSRPAGLAFTGGSSANLALLGSLLLAAGVLLLGRRRDRKRRSAV